MYWRIVYGLFRLVVGTMLLRVVGTPAIDVYRHVLHRNIQREPDDFVFHGLANYLVHHGYSITYFLACYILFWGAVDIILSIAMLRHILWAFPVSFVVIIVFVLYEVFRYSHTHSPILLTIIIIDLIILVLMRREYAKLLARAQHQTSTV
jgi:uncharacterized membrane protein